MRYDGCVKYDKGYWYIIKDIAATKYDKMFRIYVKYYFCDEQNK